MSKAGDIASGLLSTDPKERSAVIGTLLSLTGDPSTAMSVNRLVDESSRQFPLQSKQGCTPGIL